MEQIHRFGEKKFNHRANSEDLNLISARYYTGGGLPLRLSQLAGVKRPANISCVSANATTHNLLGAGKAAQCQLSSTIINQYQIVSIDSEVCLFKCQKVTFSSYSSGKMAFWLSLSQI